MGTKNPPLLVLCFFCFCGVSFFRVVGMSEEKEQLVSRTGEEEEKEEKERQEKKDSATNASVVVARGVFCVGNAGSRVEARLTAAERDGARGVRGACARAVGAVRAHVVLLVLVWATVWPLLQNAGASVRGAAREAADATLLATTLGAGDCATFCADALGAQRPQLYVARTRGSTALAFYRSDFFRSPVPHRAAYKTDAAGAFVTRTAHVAALAVPPAAARTGAAAGLFYAGEVWFPYPLLDAATLAAPAAVGTLAFAAEPGSEGTYYLLTDAQYALLAETREIPGAAARAAVPPHTRVVLNATHPHMFLVTHQRAPRLRNITVHAHYVYNTHSRALFAPMHPRAAGALLPRYATLDYRARSCFVACNTAPAAPVVLHVAEAHPSAARAAWTVLGLAVAFVVAAAFAVLVAVAAAHVARRTRALRALRRGVLAERLPVTVCAELLTEVSPPPPPAPRVSATTTTSSEDQD